MFVFEAFRCFVHIYGRRRDGQNACYVLERPSALRLQPGMPAAELLSAKHASLLSQALAIRTISHRLLPFAPHGASLYSSEASISANGADRSASVAEQSKLLLGLFAEIYLSPSELNAVCRF